MPSSRDLNYGRANMLAQEIHNKNMSIEEASARIFTELQVAQKRGELVIEITIEDANFTIVESPLRGHPDGYEAGKAYARCCLSDSIKRGETPWASHLLYTQVLDDTRASERSKGIEMHINIVTIASAIPNAKMVLYADYGVSQGMEEAYYLAEGLNMKIEKRFILPESVRVK